MFRGPVATPEPPETNAGCDTLQLSLVSIKSFEVSLFVQLILSSVHLAGPGGVAP